MIPARGDRQSRRLFESVGARKAGGEGSVTKVAAGITVSVDGYITGPGDGPGCGLGTGGERLHY
jgi:hypothetical protein